jgi:hypothetical protein
MQTHLATGQLQRYPYQISGKSKRKVIKKKIRPTKGYTSQLIHNDIIQKKTTKEEQRNTETGNNKILPNSISLKQKHGFQSRIKQILKSRTFEAKLLT